MNFQKSILKIYQKKQLKLKKHYIKEMNKLYKDTTHNHNLCLNKQQKVTITNLILVKYKYL